MELILKRIAKKMNYTIGRLYVKNELGAAYVCDTLEPPVKPTQRGQYKAIPEGRYMVAVTLSPKFGRWLPRLLGVPHRSGILIHAGNTAKDTAGCILVGQNLVVGKVLNSRSTLEALLKRLGERPEGEAIYIEVLD